MTGTNINIDENKVPVPRVTLKENSVLKMEMIAEQRGTNRSAIYQEAIDLYLEIKEFLPHKNSFKSFINKIF